MSVGYDEVPSFDIGSFYKNESSKLEFAQQLGKAYQNLGFATIYNHKLDTKLITELFSVVKQFFELPEECKMKYEIPEIFGQRGYVGKQKEKAKGFAVADLKEFFHVGQEVETDDYPRNIWPREIPEFREVTLKAYRELEDLGKTVLRALALFLNLDEHYFENMVVNGNSVLRAIHYFPIDSHPTDATRAAEHCDINFITVLLSASAEGLQVRRHDGTWIDVKPNAEQIVVNVGDMLARLTNNVLKSTVHRVVKPSHDKMQTSRYSLPFFMHPKSNTDLSCLSNCINEQQPKMYDSITAGEFLEQRLVENGLVKS